MYESHAIAVVVPAYNEEGFVGDVVRTVPDYVDRVYVVDDASTDDTWAEVREAAAACNGRGRAVRPDGGHATQRVVPIRHERNRGVGAAIKTGYARAYRDGLDVAVVMAGDGQMDPDILDRFLDPVVEGRADYAKGNRLLNWEYLRSMSRFRLFGNVLLTFLTKVASGYWRSADPQNGYTAVRLDVFDDVDVDALYDEYGFANDVLVHLNVHDKRVADVPMAASYGDEESTIRYSTFATTVSLLLLRDFLWRLNVKYLVRDFHPLALFYYAGALLGGVGLGSLLVSVLAGGLAWVVVGTLSTLFAVTLLLFAMVLDREHNLRLEPRITS